MPKKYLILILVVVPCVLYANALPNAFQYDDLHTIVNNPHIRSATLIDGLKKIPVFFATSQYYSGETHRVRHYRPLLYTTYVLNYSITGLSPIGFRMVNLALHIACVILVYLLALHLFAETTTAFLSAMIFAIHPFFSEAINYISARSSILATLFYLLAFYSFLKFRGAPAKPLSKKTAYFLIFVSSTFLAFLSKEIAITLPLILGVYDFFFLKKTRSKLNLELFLPYLPVALLSILLLLKIDFIQYFKEVYLHIDMNAILAQIKGLALMIWLFVVPIGLSIDHGISRPTSVLEPGILGSILVLITILGCAFFLRRSQRVLGFCSVWFVMTALPTSIVPLNIPLLEHRGYLPGAGLAMIMGWVLGNIATGHWTTERKKARSQNGAYKIGGVVLCTAIFTIYAGISLHRNTVWKNPISLWSDAVAHAPKSDRAWTNLGLAYMDQKDYKRALEAFDQSLLLNPDAVIARVGRGSIYHLEGRLDEAIQIYQDAISLYPDYFLSYFNLGVAYQQQGRFEKAWNAYQEALKINVHHPETHLNLGSVHLALNQFELAIAEYQEALRMNPELIDAHYNLGVAYEAMGQTELANRHYEEAESMRKHAQ